MRIVEIHTPAEVAAEIERMRPEIATLITSGVLRPWCLEEDLRTEAYNRLTMGANR